MATTRRGQRRRGFLNVFGLSFLDVMFCGFGSVILLVMLVNADAVARREGVQEDLRRTVARLEHERLEGGRHLVELRGRIDATRVERAAIEQALQTAQTRVAAARGARVIAEDEARARRDRVEQLKPQLVALEDRVASLREEAVRDRDGGNRARAFLGEGDRQYLTGLRLGGQRILLLLDSSASMLDDTLVNVLRRRNMSASERRAAPKWRQAVAAVEWLLSQLPPDGSYQVYVFDTEARPLVADKTGGWLPVSDAASLDDVADALHRLAPQGGTSLHRAFRSAARINPPPDNIVLLTDGLPTQGLSRPAAAKVSARQRLQIFNSALAELPPAVPVNTLLFAMEGDPMAASAFWKLAGATNGALVAPAGDWP